MDQEPFQLQPPETPFQVSVILAEIFSNLEYPDLANCRQVSKLWDCEASKQLWKVGRIRPISWDWTTVENNLRRALANGEETVHLAETNEILDVFRSRIPSSKDSLIFVKIGSPELSPAARNFYRSHYHDVGRTIHGFLTDPILCNILAFIELELFADFDVILHLLSDLPNLREFTVNFDIVTFVNTQSVIPKWHKTSSVRVLALGFNLQTIERESEDTEDVEVADSQQRKFGACVRLILGGCVNLKVLKLVDNTGGTLLDVMDTNFLEASLKNPEHVQALELQSFKNVVDNYTAPEKLQPINFFSRITHLDLCGWGELNLESWKSVISNNYLPSCLMSFQLTVLEPDSDANLPKKLIHEQFVDAGLGRFQSLVWLSIDLHLGVIDVSRYGDWVEQWEYFEDDHCLALVSAKVAFKAERTPIDLRPHKHLRSLTLLVDQSDLTEALKLVPATLDELDVGSWSPPIFQIMMTDDDFRRDGALKAISGLGRFRIKHSCHHCSISILKFVFAEMKNLRFVQLPDPDLHFTENQLEEYGLQNVTFSGDKLAFDL